MSRPALAPIGQAFPGTQPGSTARHDGRSGWVRRRRVPNPYRGRTATTTRGRHPLAHWCGVPAKNARINCSKFTCRLRCVIMTPVGSRVEPELYCRYATLGKSSVRRLVPPSASRFIESISTIFGMLSRRASSTYSATSSANAEVVRTTEGDVSARTASTRSWLAPRCGNGSGTAMSPACIDPRKAVM